MPLIVVKNCMLLWKINCRIWKW